MLSFPQLGLISYRWFIAGLFDVALIVSHISSISASWNPIHLILILIDVFKTDLMTWNLPNHVIVPDLTQF